MTRPPLATGIVARRPSTRALLDLPSKTRSKLKIHTSILQLYFLGKKDFISSHPIRVRLPSSSPDRPTDRPSPPSCLPSGPAAIAYLLSDDGGGGCSVAISCHLEDRMRAPSRRRRRRCRPPSLVPPLSIRSLARSSVAVSRGGVRRQEGTNQHHLDPGAEEGGSDRGAIGDR